MKKNMYFYIFLSTIYLYFCHYFANTFYLDALIPEVTQ